MKEGNFFVCFVCDFEILQTIAPLAMFLVLLESL
jgi:hypothetical protein